jgi:ribosomal protein S18 acetylase RimI-like enzyme
VAGVATYRTPALSTNDARWFFDHGFVARQSLVMLQRTGRLGSAAIGRGTPIGVEYDDVTCRHVMARQRERLLSELLHIDGESFAAPWNLSPPAFRHACRATSEHRVIIASGSDADGSATGSAIGYVIVGRSAGQAYLQRLAVHPTHRRTGIARSLVWHASQWAGTRGADSMLVNTEPTNTAALALYHSLGFVTLPDPLVVLARPVHATAGVK